MVSRLPEQISGTHATQYGEALIASMRARTEEHASGGPVYKTGELYSIHYVCGDGSPFMAVSKKCRTCPMFAHGVYQVVTSGESMRALSEDEKRALQIVVLKTNVKQERYGATHHANWKKVGLSRATYTVLLLLRRICRPSKRRQLLYG